MRGFGALGCVVVLACGVGCNFSTHGGAATVADDIGSGGDDGGSGSSPASGSSGASTAPATMSGGNDGESSGGSTSSPVATSEPMSTGEETAGPLDSSGDDVAPGSSSSDASTSDDPSNGSSSSDDGDPPPPGYPECPSGNDGDCPENFNCIPIYDEFDNIVASWCGSMLCDSGDDCPAAPPGAAAVPQCYEPSTMVCTLTCDFASDCPDGMDCISTQGLGWVCAWPN